MEQDNLTPPQRLKAYRIDSGYKTVKDFCQALKEEGFPIDYQRLLALEKKSLPTPYEWDGICQLLCTTSDCLLRGVCDTNHQLTETTRYMNDRQIKTFLLLADSTAKTIIKNNIQTGQI